MTFSNPASDAAENAPAYVEAVLGLLGDEDPLTVLGQLLPALEYAVQGLSDADLRRPEAPGKWSILQVVRHLADTELVCGYRIRLTLGENEPPLTGFDQDRWAARMRYEDSLLSDSLAMLGAVRDANLALYRSLSDEDWKRQGIHQERGPETVRRMVKLSAGHDLVHRAQIGRIREQLQREAEL